MIVTWLFQRLTNALPIWFWIEENNETRGEFFFQLQDLASTSWQQSVDKKIKENGKIGILFYWLISLNSKL